MKDTDNIDFNSIVIFDFGNYRREIPLTNDFGPLYPRFSEELLAALLKIKATEKVIDIGGGDNPFPRADVVVEPYPHNSSHRSGTAIPPGINYVEAFAEDLPFEDREFDVAISRQVLEHVQSPAAACREMMRVARRGYIETPQKIYDILLGPNPGHNWFITLKENKLIFERRMFVRHPFRHPGLAAVPSSAAVQFLLHYEFANITNIQFYWEDKFDFEIIDHAEGFDYNNPAHAAEAHLDMAICSLLHGGHYLEAREHDAREAIRLRPGWALAHNTLGVILWKQKKNAEAKKEFRKAAQIEPREEFLHNSGLNKPSEEPVIVDFDYRLPIDEKFFSSYAGASSINIFELLYGKRE
jgi:SAM-dependent methyltransferase